MLAWQTVGQGWAAGRFEIRPVHPAGWDLIVSGTHRGRYSRASTAPPAAARMERLRRRRLGVGLRLGAVLAIAGLIALVIALRMEANPDRSAAVDLSKRIDAAYEAVVGGAPISSIGDPGLRAEVVQLPKGGQVLMITGEAGGDCYSFYWSDTRGPIARVLLGTLPCEPSAVSAQSGHNVYHRQTPVVSGHLPGFGAEFDWEGVLPPPSASGRGSYPS